MSRTTVTASQTESAVAEADKEFGHDYNNEGHPEKMENKGDDTGRHIMIGAGSIGKAASFRGRAE